MQNVINEMNINFFSRSCNEGFARSVVASFVSQLDPTIDELADIKTAVSEAVTNCIVHGYKSGIGKIYISSKIYENGKILIKIKDKGCGIGNIEQAMEPLFTTGGSDRSGLGFAVMQSFMDKIKVTSKVGKGTTVTLQKFIIRRPVKNER